FDAPDIPPGADRLRDFAGGSSMTQDHVERVADNDSAPHPTPRAATSLHPKTVTVFLDAGPGGKRRATYAAEVAQRWDAHLVGIHVVPESATLHPSNCHAVGEKAITQVIAMGQKLKADAEAAATSIGEHFHKLCREMNVAGEFRLIRGGRAE